MTRRIKKIKNETRNQPAELMQPLEARRFLSVTPAIDFTPFASSSTVPGYSPSQISTAYGLTGLTFGTAKTAATGAGQTIAIVDAYNDPNIAADLKTFDTKFGLAAANLKVVSQTGSTSLPATNGGWAEEISLDVEWVHAVAPGANILLVETKSSSDSDLLAGVNYARGVSGVSVVSLSWGGSEFNGQTSYDSYFTTPTGHTGVTFVAASGDEGSAYGVDWPASSPDVLSVGGTGLTVTSSGAYSSETGWVDSTGGVSRYEGEPEYQSKVQSLDARTVPDVAADANPDTGVAVYDSYSYEGVSGWVEFGGTSAAAPQWAGMIAIADQGRVINKLGTLDGATNTLPTLYSLQANTSTYSSDFHDITSGASSRSISAAKGYDLITGIGSAKANGLIPALASSTTSTKLTVTTVVYAPPPPPPRGGYFLATASTVVPTQAAVDAPTSFTTTVPGVGTLAVEQSRFDTESPASTRIVSIAGSYSATFNSTTPVAAGAPGSGASTSVSSASVFPITPTAPNAAPAFSMTPIESLERELLSVSAYAQAAIAELGRDMAIDWSHTAAEPVVNSLVQSFATVSNEVRSTAVGVAAVIAAVAILQKEPAEQNSKKPSIFSTQMIEPLLMRHTR